MPIGIFDVIGELIDGVGWMSAGLSGFRYLFSTTHRQDVHQRWKNATGWTIAWEIVVGVTGMLLIGLLVYGAIAIFGGVHWFEHLLGFRGSGS